MRLPFLSYKLWKLRTELQKQTIQIASKYSKKKKKNGEKEDWKIKANHMAMGCIQSQE